jgi:hypothetical protein
MSDMYSRLQSQQLGSVQVLGDAAIPVDVPPNPVKYQNQTYKTAEEINLGLGGRFVVPAAAGPGPTQTTVLPIPSPNTSLPFMAQRITIRSAIAPFFIITNAKIAAIDLIDGEPICADIFSEVSLNSGIRWPTAQTGQQIQVSVGNVDPTSAHEPIITLTGVRLRP